MVPLPSTATLRAGRTTVWYWPQRQGDLDTVSQDDTRTVTAGDGINVNESGRAELSFADFNVQLYRHAQHQMIPTADPNGYGLGYDLLQRAALNPVSANALQALSNDRIDPECRSRWDRLYNHLKMAWSRACNRERVVSAAMIRPHGKLDQTVNIALG